MAPGTLDRLEQLTVTDCLGIERKGYLVWLPRWNHDAASAIRDLGAEFAIAVLQEPASLEDDLPSHSVFCLPALRSAGRGVREPAATYEVARTTPTEIARSHQLALAAGTMVSGSGRPLRIAPADVFTQDGPRFDLLAQELLLSEDFAEVCDSLSASLVAPASPPEDHCPETYLAELRELIQKAFSGATATGEPAQSLLLQAIERLSQLAAREKPDALVATARRAYPDLAQLPEDIYLLRLLIERPDQAVELLRVRSWVESAALPPGESDLALDKAIALEHLRFANIVPEPAQANILRLAANYFQTHYRTRYEAHHSAYWQSMSRTRSRLVEARRQVAALERLNTLIELGPPIGERALENYRELLEETAGCSNTELKASLAESTFCPVCNVRLDQKPSDERIADVLSRIERATRRHMARLSSVAVRRLLEGHNDPRIERFLKVVQASQLSSLADVLDDSLVGYLRRFLVEGHLASILEPLLATVEQGGQVAEEEARQALQDIARLMERALSSPKRPPLPGARERRGSVARMRSAGDEPPTP